jgi:transcriptional regulator with XRE-family HTH domain
MFGATLREIRKRKGLTAEQLGQKIGKTDRTIHRLETGQVNATLPVLIDLCNVLEVTSDYFLNAFFLSGQKEKEYLSKYEQFMTEIVKMDIKEIEFVLRLMQEIHEFKR